MSKKNTFYVTSPIFYPNANPHMGHAYTTLLCDVLARYHRLKGFETYFLTGTDEHTEKVIQAAEILGEAPDVYLENIVERFKHLYRKLNISYDQFIRTSDQQVHWPGAILMWKRLVETGDIYKGKYAGLYCMGCEKFLTEKDLVDGMCPDHNRAPEKINEENYFFRLSTYGDKLRKLIDSNDIRIVPESRKYEILALIDSGLEDVSFSRPKEKMSWGIPVPGDPSQTMYIWVDALTNYITALGFGRGEERMYFWPGVHVLGKDILRFHAAFWPAMLLSAKLPLPRALFAHGLITSGGRKMSKTLGNVIDPFELIDEYGTDAVRYYLIRHVSPFSDGDVTKEGFRETYNGELANGLGNLVSRVMKMAENYSAHINVSAESDLDAEGEGNAVMGEYQAAFESYALNRAADVVWKRISVADEKITREEPFRLFKGDPEKAREIVRELVREVYHIGTMLEPLMPTTAALIKDAVKENRMPAPLFLRKE